jgi:hypothetical protein
LAGIEEVMVVREVLQAGEEGVLEVPGDGPKEAEEVLVEVRGYGAQDSPGELFILHRII